MAGRVDQRTEKESLPGDKPRSPVRRQMTHCPHDQQVMSCVHGASDRLSSGLEGSVAAGEHGQVLRPPGATPSFCLPVGTFWGRTGANLLSIIFRGIRGVFRTVQVRERHAHNGELTGYEAVQLAKQEWLSAIEYFHEVSEPDLVDYAIYSLHAAERKYMYLLAKARKEYTSLS